MPSVANLLTDYILASKRGEELVIEWPCSHRPAIILSAYGEERTAYTHEGIDIRAYTGDEVYSGTPGAVGAVSDGSGAYGIYVRVDCGRWRLYYCHLSKAVVQVGQQVTIGQKVGEAGSTGNSTGAHLHFTLVDTTNPIKLRGIALAGCVNPAPFLRYPAAPVSVRGVGMGHTYVLTPAEQEALRISQVGAVKVLAGGDPGDMRVLVRQIQAIRSDMFIMARLFFKPDCEGKVRFTPGNFVAVVLPCAATLYEMGVRYFEVGNEPNLTVEGMGWNWEDGKAFGLWFSEAADTLRLKFPQIKIGFPGLSPQLNVPTFLNGAQSAIEKKADWLGVHCYWDNDSVGHWGMLSEDGGMYWRNFRRTFPKIPLIITEFSNNNAATSYADRGKQYRSFYSMLGGDVLSAFAFALSWPGQDARHEAWVTDEGVVTDIPRELGR